MLDNPDQELEITSPQDPIDPDLLTLSLALGAFIVQVGSVVTVAKEYTEYKEEKREKEARIRAELFKAERALNKANSTLVAMASLLDEFNYFETPMRIGNAPVSGFDNAKVVRRAHEDCLAAVREVRDVFISLSGLLKSSNAADACFALIRLLDELSPEVIVIGPPYGQFICAVSLALDYFDRFICYLGESYDFERAPRNYFEENTKHQRLDPFREPLLGQYFPPQKWDRRTLRELARRYR